MARSSASVEALQQRVSQVVALFENMSNCVGDVGSWRCLLSKRLHDSLEQRVPRRFRFPLRPWAERSRRRPERAFTLRRREGRRWGIRLEPASEWRSECAVPRADGV